VATGAYCQENGFAALKATCHSDGLRSCGRGLETSSHNLGSAPPAVARSGKPLV
jgi:hypothetical protein